MLKTIEEIKEVEIEAGVVVNGVDNPNTMSIDSTDPIMTRADEDKNLNNVNETVEVVEEKVVEEKEEVEEVEEKVDTKTKTKKKEAEEVEEDDTTDSKKVTKRIGALTKKWRTAERERDFEREKRVEVEKELKKLSANIPDEDKPLKEDFDDEDEFIEALTSWKVDVKLKTSQVEVTKEIEDKDEQQAVLETYDGLDDAMEKGREKFEDFNELVLDANLIISPEVTQILLDTESPEDIMYYLASDPEFSEKISGLSSVKAAREIGKIEAKLLKEVEVEVVEEEVEKPKPKPKLKKQSKAPAPITPVKTTGVTEKDPNKMSPKEYRAWRESK